MTPGEINALCLRLTKMADDCESSEDAETGKDGTFVHACSSYLYDDLIEAVRLIRENAQLRALVARQEARIAKQKAANVALAGMLGNRDQIIASLREELLREAG